MRRRAYLSSVASLPIVSAISSPDLTEEYLNRLVRSYNFECLELVRIDSGVKCNGDIIRDYEIWFKDDNRDSVYIWEIDGDIVVSSLDINKRVDSWRDGFEVLQDIYPKDQEPVYEDNDFFTLRTPVVFLPEPEPHFAKTLHTEDAEYEIVTDIHYDYTSEDDSVISIDDEVSDIVWTNDLDEEEVYMEIRDSVGKIIAQRGLSRS